MRSMVVSRIEALIRQAHDPDPDQDPALFQQALQILCGALANLVFRPVRAGDQRVLCGGLFRGVEDYLRLMADAVATHPGLFPPGMDRLLTRKQARVTGWTALRATLETLLQKVIASQIREQAEMLVACSDIEGFVRTGQGRDPLEVQQQRIQAITPALAIREAHRQHLIRRQREARAAKLKAAAPSADAAKKTHKPAPAQGWLGGRPVHSIDDWSAREQMLDQINNPTRRRP